MLHFVHTEDFDDSITDIGMTDRDLRVLQAILQDNPEAGRAMPRTGGVRKLRVSLGIKAKGKRGGARLLYYFSVRRWTVYLLLAYDKSYTGDISEQGRKALRVMAQALRGDAKS